MIGGGTFVAKLCCWQHSLRPVHGLSIMLFSARLLRPAAKPVGCFATCLQPCWRLLSQILLRLTISPCAPTHMSVVPYYLKGTVCHCLRLQECCLPPLQASNLYYPLL